MIGIAMVCGTLGALLVFAFVRWAERPAPGPPAGQCDCGCAVCCGACGPHANCGTVRNGTRRCAMPKVNARIADARGVLVKAVPVEDGEADALRDWDQRYKDAAGGHDA